VNSYELTLQQPSIHTALLYPFLNDCKEDENNNVQAQMSIIGERKKNHD
jgi:hypothetical protein